MSNKKNESTELQTVSESGDVPTSDVVEATVASFVTPTGSGTRRQAGTLQRSE